MKVFGVQLQEGSSISNLTVASGTAFPDLPNDAELFYRTDADTRVVGLYVYIGGVWERLASASAVTIPSGASLPTQASIGDLFYSSDPAIGLSIFNGSAWESPGSNVSAIDVYDALFTTTQTDTATLLNFMTKYSLGSTRVWVGGVRQKRNVDYVESSQNEISLNYIVSDVDIASGLNIVVDYITPGTTATNNVYDAPFNETEGPGTTIIDFIGNYGAGSTRVWVDGLRQKRNIDYIESASNRITLNFNVLPESNIIVDYVAAL
jgi:hypothetical protein